jgi:hypothetical protein
MYCISILYAGGLGSSGDDRSIGGSSSGNGDDSILLAKGVAHGSIWAGPAALLRPGVAAGLRAVAFVAFVGALLAPEALAVGFLGLVVDLVEPADRSSAGLASALVRAILSLKMRSYDSKKSSV